MELFGRYRGKNVYTVELPTYVGNKFYDDEVDMYLIRGDLIYKNQIIGRWDGKMVHEWDPHERSVFYKKTVKKEPEIKPTEVFVEPTHHKTVEVADSQPAASVEDILAGVYEWQVC
jgi:hypothetical protein